MEGIPGINSISNVSTEEGRREESLSRPCNVFIGQVGIYRSMKKTFVENGVFHSKFAISNSQGTDKKVPDSECSK